MTLKKEHSKFVKSKRLFLSQCFGYRLLELEIYLAQFQDQVVLVILDLVKVHQGFE